MASTALRLPSADFDCRRTALYALIDFCSMDDRVCPAPGPWHRLWRMLPADGRRGMPRRPPACLESRDTAADNGLKWALVDHLLWADETGVLSPVERYLRSLPAEQWLKRSEA